MQFRKRTNQFLWVLHMHIGFRGGVFACMCDQVTEINLFVNVEKMEDCDNSWKLLNP